MSVFEELQGRELKDTVELGPLFPGLCDEELVGTIYQKNEKEVYLAVTYFGIYVGSAVVLADDKVGRVS